MYKTGEFAQLDEPVRFSVLGPVRAWRGKECVDLGPPQQRAVLAVLLLAEGAPVSGQELIDKAWDGRAPGSAISSVRSYIHRLRSLVGASVIKTVDSGYQTRLSDGDLDLTSFRKLTAFAEQAASRQDHPTVVAALREALGLWQGPALAGMHGWYADSQRIRLEALRTAAQGTYLAAELDLGAHAEVVSQLTELVNGDPLNERFREMLMVALYRSGRQAAALESYLQARDLLQDALGVDPSPALQTMYQRILRADQSLLVERARAYGGTSPAASVNRDESIRLLHGALAAPAQLPADLATFVGREEAMKEARRLTPDIGAEPSAAMLSVVTGMAGVGKTAFAVHWARTVADRFPDGQLYVNLRGFDSSHKPLAAKHALRTLLEAFGVPSHSIPEDVDALAARFRTVLSGRRVLLLLDNARDAAQVRPLLPGMPGCLTIVTSRNQLTGLIASDAAWPIRLDVLPTEEGRDFLARRIGEERVAAEPEAVEVIMEQCGRLPLALSIAAARAALRATFPLASLAEELREGWGSLDSFTDAEPGSTTDVRAVFSWSYKALTPATARLFRMLSLHPGPDLSLAAAASLAGLTRPHTRQLLAELVQACLIEETAPARYALRDLLRAYARELFAATDTPKDGESAMCRMLDYYLHSAFAAGQHFAPDRYAIRLHEPTAQAFPESFANVEEAIAWFTSEQAVLMALIAQTEARRIDEYAWRLAWAMEDFLDRRGLSSESEATQMIAMKAAARLHDPTARAYASRGRAR
ncbi:BTAD domain-containing putative transcriptional regulator [Streptomyces sp. TRM75561]|uniref:AfsR/SARP family transcriptional regulator n=1 Tax=Streptomyces sp. TRM75561 TaxID=2975269 RepID=UPI00244864B3|nr:BTAD domain-containing putative transcriptional regulator [Streptomyces sp. TRM75561]MDH3039323.1 BTAD domain-containing putative transcriptional regulator [Streptomyces sp. TRM75561]